MTTTVSTALRVLFFGRVADLIGREVLIEMPAEGCTLADLRRRLADAPGGEILLKPGVRASIDKQVVAEDAWVRPGAEVAFFSVFSGG